METKIQEEKAYCPVMDGTPVDKAGAEELGRVREKLTVKNITSVVMPVSRILT